jgi:hypothetical protein
MTRFGRRIWAGLIAVIVVAWLAGCGTDRVGYTPAPAGPTAKAADFTAAELIGRTIYSADPASRTGTYDALTYNADGTVSAVTLISASSAGTATSGTWSVSSGILQVTLSGKPSVTYTKVSATPDSDEAFTVASGPGAPALKWFYSQTNGAAQALACATGGTIPAPATLVALALNPASLTTSVGWTQRFTAAGTYSDGSTRDLTASVAWSSSDTGVAAIVAGGLATAVAAGPATITASSGAVKASASISVTYDQPHLQSISISAGGSQKLVNLPVGGSQQLRVIGTYTGNATQDLTSQVSWSSSDPSVATVTSSGLVTSVGTGEAMISARAETDISPATITVLSGETILPIAGAYLVPGFADGTGAAARFSYPSALATDGTFLYVVDSGNNCIRKVTIATGAVTTLAGSSTAWGATDGVGSTARFYYPSGITSDGANLYVTDLKNNTIRKIVIASGAVSTIAGSPGLSGSVDGIGANARFNGPTGITTDGKLLYVADGGSMSLRTIDLATNAVATLATASTFSDLGVTVTGMAGMTTDGVNVYGIVTNFGYLSYSYIFKVAMPSGTVSILPPASPYNNPVAITTDGATLFVTNGATHYGSYVIYMTPLAGGKVTRLSSNSGANNVISGLTLAGKTVYVATGYFQTIGGIQLQ